MTTTEEKFVESAKRWIDDITQHIIELQNRRKEIAEQLQACCTHPDIVDLTETHGTHCDNGYGKWWRAPYFKCGQCNAMDENYQAGRLNKERKERLESNDKRTQAFMEKTTQTDIL